MTSKGYNVPLFRWILSTNKGGLKMVKMFMNYGDHNFFESGRLVSVWVNDDNTVDENGSEYHVLYCQPFCDAEMYAVADCFIDINDTWIDKTAVESFGGVRKEKEPLYYALACIDYYGAENFNGGYSMTVDAENENDIRRWVENSGFITPDVVFESVF